MLLSVPAIAVDRTPPEAADNLHTVSFQTLSQTRIDQAAAEQALAQAQGYVAGSSALMHSSN